MFTAKGVKIVAAPQIFDYITVFHCCMIASLWKDKALAMQAFFKLYSNYVYILNDVEHT